MTRRRGSIFQRKDRWIAQLPRPVDERGRPLRDPLTGKRLSPTQIGTFPNREAAERALTAELGKLDKGLLPGRTGDTTIAAYLEDWLNRREVNGEIKPTTAAGYRQHFSYIVPALGQHRLKDLRPHHIAGFYTGLRQRGGTEGAGLSAATVRRISATLSKAMNDAVALGMISANPVSRVPKPKNTARYEFSTWSPTETAQFLESVAVDRLGAMWRLFCTTGLRRGEVLGLRWSDIDWANKRLMIRQGLTRTARRTHFSSPKSGRSRAISVDDRTLGAVRDHRKAQSREQELAGAVWVDSGLVFVNEIGEPLHPDAISKGFPKLAEQAGLPRIRLHDVRHSWATHALRLDTHPKVVSEHLGHATISLTLDTYSHVMPSLDQQVADDVAALIDGAAGK